MTPPDQEVLQQFCSAGQTGMEIWIVWSPAGILIFSYFKRVCFIQEHTEETCHLFFLSSWSSLIKIMLGVSLGVGKTFTSYTIVSPIKFCLLLTNSASMIMHAAVCARMLCCVSHQWREQRPRWRIKVFMWPMSTPVQTEARWSAGTTVVWLIQFTSFCHAYEIFIFNRINWSNTASFQS